MTKAERRKRARQKAREAAKQPVAGASEATIELPAEGPATAFDGMGLDEAADFGSNSPRAVPDEEESEFITGPVVAKPEPGPRTATPARLDVPRALIGEVESEDEEDEDDEDDGDEEDGDDDGPLDEDDALFQLACASLEEPNMTWNELVTWLLAVEVEDPRLALLATLLVTKESTSEPPPLSGARVIKAFETLGLDDLVEEAREAVANAPKQDGEEADKEREIVRTSARELAALGKKELAGGGEKQKQGPRRASELRAEKRGSEPKRGGV